MAVHEIPYTDDVLCGSRNKWTGVSEREWCKFAMSRNADWLKVLGKDKFDSYELEYQVSLGDKSRKSGLPRIDAVGWRAGRATLIEAKVHVSASLSMGGVGQLLYYKEVVDRFYGWDVEELILLSPAWPPLLVDVIERNKIPVSLVQATTDMFYGYRTLKNDGR